MNIEQRIKAIKEKIQGYQHMESGDVLIIPETEVLGGQSTPSNQVNNGKAPAGSDKNPVTPEEEPVPINVGGDDEEGSEGDSEGQEGHGHGHGHGQGQDGDEEGEEGQGGQGGQGGEEGEEGEGGEGGESGGSDDEKDKRAKPKPKYKVGDIVRVKSTGQTKRITKVNPDGTYVTE